MNPLNELYRQSPEGFLAALQEPMRTAVPLRKVVDEAIAARAAELSETCHGLAHAPRILDRLTPVLAALGLAGEERNAKLLFLGLATRRFDRPIAIVVKGPSSGGKSFVVEQVLTLIPAADYYLLTAMSEYALVYIDEPLAHRFLVLFEAPGIGAGRGNYFIRSLVSEGCIRYQTSTEGEGEGRRGRFVELLGPIGLILTTTETTLDPELETRMLSLTINDTREQTGRVLRAIARGKRNRPVIDLEEWRALQEWLDLAGEHHVHIPFAEDLAGLISPVAVRLRRDFSLWLNLVAAHAWLHQASRDRDDEGWVVAEVEDYAVVRELVADLIADQVEATVSDATKETVRAVTHLQGLRREGVSYKRVAEHLKVDKSTAWRRLAVAAEHGFVRNLETRQGAASRWVVGDSLPEDRELLPSPQALNLCIIAGLTEGIGGTPPRFPWEAQR